MMSERDLLEFSSQTLVMYILNKKNMSVTLSDGNKYILTDSKNDMNKKYIVGVQRRNFHSDRTKEGKSDVYTYTKIAKLEENAKKENRIPIIAFVFVDDDLANKKIIRVFLIEVAELKTLCKNSKVEYVNESLHKNNEGIRFKCSRKHLDDISRNSAVDYTELTISYSKDPTNKISFINR